MLLEIVTNDVPGLNFVATQVSGIFSETSNSNSFVVYPNPTTGVFVINNGACPIVNFIDVEIFDVAGRLALCVPFTVNRETAEVDISHLQNGVYFVKIGGEMVKVVKK